jgi:hypothetical protein
MDLDVASTITAAGGAVALILRAVSTRRVSRTRDLERRVAELEDALLGWAQWAHNARVTAAASGCRLPAIPMPRSTTETAERGTV